MTAPDPKARALALVGELLDEARIKRAAVELANRRCDPMRVKQMTRDAALMEAAANAIDSAHECEAWRIDP